MGDFIKYLEHISDDLKTLNGDIQRIIKSKSDKKDFKDTSLKSMQRVTTLYKNKEEIIKAKENPEEAFIIKQVNEIFGK